jgi:hypothetical protein
MARLQPTTSFPRATVLAAIVMGGLALPCFSQDSTGEHDFRLYCSDCHGEDGRGDGPKTFGLSGPAPGLTGLASRNGGVFPRERLQAVIDGREIVKNHGSREMPVWGLWFKMEAEEDLGGAEGDESTVQRRITALIDFLETLQDP